MPVQIVEVIRSERTGGLQAPQPLVAYSPLAQLPRQDIDLVVRTRGEPAAAVSGGREALRQIEPHLALGNVRTSKCFNNRWHLVAVFSGDRFAHRSYFVSD